MSVEISEGEKIYDRELLSVQAYLSEKRVGFMTIIMFIKIQTRRKNISRGGKKSWDKIFSWKIWSKMIVEVRRKRVVCRHRRKILSHTLGTTCTAKIWFWKSNGITGQRSGIIGVKRNKVNKRNISRKNFKSFLFQKIWPNESGTNSFRSIIKIFACKFYLSYS